MSNNRYVILNCPALMGNRLCYSKEIKQCADCTDCVMKQIVSRLNNFAEDYGLDAGFYADELLSYLDIQEAE